MSDPETLKVYAEKAQDYATLTKETGVDPRLETFIAALPAGGHVLDLGCGPGHEAAVMAHAGVRVTATDAVPEMVAMAQGHDGVHAVLATFDDIDGAQIYDGVWANFCLLHASRVDMPRHLAALHKALKPGGVIHVALKSGTGSKRDALGRHYTYYTEPEISDLMATAGFTITGRDAGSGKGLDGVVAPWIAIVAHA